MRENPLLAAALQYARRGWRVIPLHSPTGKPDMPCSCQNQACDKPGKHPRISAWPTEASTDESVLRRWWSQWPRANVGLACGAGSGIWAMDVDGPAGRQALRRIQEEHPDTFPRTPHSITGGGGDHYLFAYEPGLKNEVRFARGLDLRTDGGLIVAPPSIHVTGAYYIWDNNADPESVAPAPAPDYILKLIRESKPLSARTAGTAGETITQGSRNQTLWSSGCAMRRRGMTENEIYAALAVANEERCDPALPEEVVRDLAHRASGYVPAAPTNGTGLPVPALVEETPTSFASFALLASAAQKPNAPITLEPEALYGLPGDIVRAIDPHTESHPAAVLGSLLVGSGCLIGPRPCLYRDAGRLTANEFVALVGLSAKGRKGTGTRRAEELLKSVSDSDSNNRLHVKHEEPLYESLRLSGLGSGEAMIEALADKDADRRRIIVEEEFSRCLKVMRREGSTLSEALRSAWDGGILANRTKGKSLRARDTHVAILAHITEEELKAELSGPALYNGFANRFLWICCARSKSLPLGGGRPKLAPLVQRLQETLVFARKAETMEFDADTQAIWTPQGEVYDRLIERPPGLLGAVTSRAEAHVSRLALLYALLDLEREIRVPHLLAALAVWDFAEKSAAYLFGVSSGDDTADRIEEALWAASPGALTLREIHDLFHRHARAGAIKAALGLLLSQGKAQRSLLSTPGRPAELWSLAVRGASEQSERSELSPLQRAREMAAALGYPKQ